MSKQTMIHVRFLVPSTVLNFGRAEITTASQRIPLVEVLSSPQG